MCLVELGVIYILKIPTLKRIANKKLNSKHSTSYDFNHNSLGIRPLDPPQHYRHLQHQHFLRGLKLNHDHTCRLMSPQSQ
jgi:hypothetical protein